MSKSLRQRPTRRSVLRTTGAAAVEGEAAPESLPPVCRDEGQFTISAYSHRAASYHVSEVAVYDIDQGIPTENEMITPFCGISHRECCIRYLRIITP